MKININTKDKLIRLDESVSLGDLFTQLEELLPDMKWREYTLLAKDDGPICLQITPKYEQPHTGNPSPFFTYTTS